VLQQQLAQLQYVAEIEICTVLSNFAEVSLSVVITITTDKDYTGNQFRVTYKIYSFYSFSISTTNNNSECDKLLLMNGDVCINIKRQILL